MHIFTQKLINTSIAHASKPALMFPSEILTYSSLYSKANELAQLLSKQGIEKGDRVAFLGTRTAFDFISIMAILICEAVYVPINPKFPLDRIKYILNKSGALGLLLDEQNSNLSDRIWQDIEKKESSLSFIISGNSFQIIKASGVIRKQGKFEGGAYIIFTSGTTGTPKGVPITLDNLSSYFESIDSLYPIYSNDRVVNNSDLSFDLSVHELFSAWRNGAPLCVIRQDSGLLAVRYVKRYEATIWTSVPSLVSISKKYNTLQVESMPHIRLAFFCGEALSKQTAVYFQEASPNAQIINLWGPTEATVSFTHFQIDWSKKLPDVIPIGEPYLGQELRIIDEEGMNVQEGDIGELLQSGSQLTSGYWEAPELNKERFLIENGKRWYRSGDLCHYHSDYGYCFHGRVDRQVKIKGYRVELQACEAALRKAANIDLVCVVPAKRLEDGSIIELIGIVCSSYVNQHFILNYLQENLPSYMIPSHIISINNFPFNSNGKIDFNLLEKMATEELEKFSQ